jgi:hypothetical protein
MIKFKFKQINQELTAHYHTLTLMTGRSADGITYTLTRLKYKRYREVKPA